MRDKKGYHKQKKDKESSQGDFGDEMLKQQTKMKRFVDQNTTEH